MSAPTDTRSGQPARDTQTPGAAAGPSPAIADQFGVDTQMSHVGGGSPNSPDPTTGDPTPKMRASGPAFSTPTIPLGGQMMRGTHGEPVAEGLDSGSDQRAVDTHTSSVAAAPTRSAPARGRATPKIVPPVLDDPALLLAADVLDDWEKGRISNENRLRQMTRAVTDKDGEDRGLGYDATHPDVLALGGMIQAMYCQSKPVIELLGKKPGGKGCCFEHDAERLLTSMLKKHPLHGWVKRTRGVGEKQAARLLASIGDPYWNDLHDRPRLVSELWSFCGYGDAEKQVRRKGEKIKWSPEAKMRAHMVSESTMKQLVQPCHVVYEGSGPTKRYVRAVHLDGCVCSPYRVVYDRTRAKYADAVHIKPCVRCGPKGKPAQPGSPISAKHNEARAHRAVCKELLADLWREAKRLHDSPGDHDSRDTQAVAVAGETFSTHEAPE